MDSDKSVFISSSNSVQILEGEIQTSNKQNQLSTLDEPVFQTIKRDIGSVFHKFNHVIFPRQSTKLLEQWDLWGPLILITTLAILLQSRATEQSHGVQFAEIFSLIFFGSIIVTLNSQLLGGKLSIFQTICVLGYCLLPLILSSIANHFLSLLLPWKSYVFLIRFFIVMFALIWTLYASHQFLRGTYPTNRRLLVFYPIFLFNFVLSWLIILRK